MQIFQSPHPWPKRSWWSHPRAYTVIYPPPLLPRGSVGESACQFRGCRRPRFYPWVPKIPWRRKWQPTPVFLPRKCRGQRSLAGCSPWGRRESDSWVHVQLLDTAHPHPPHILPPRTLLSSFLDHLVHLGSSSVMLPGRHSLRALAVFPVEF